MCRGTDLPRDHVVATLPPMNGQATVERIAINGVMAGCTPTMMPILIAIAHGMGGSRGRQAGGWTCSNAGWLPTIVISGPIRTAIGINAGRTFCPAYTGPRPIARAMAYLIMNISGVRMQQGGYERPGQTAASACAWRRMRRNLPPVLAHPARRFGSGGRAIMPSPCFGPVSTTSCPPSPSAPRWSGCVPCGTAALTWGP